MDVELGLILEEENSGVDADGLPIVRPALRAYFKRSDDLNLGLVFKANYNTYIDPNNQNLILTNPTVLGASNPSQGAAAPGASGSQSMSASSNQEITSIRGKLEGDTITANVLTGAGILGKISLKLKDKATEASSLGLQNDINEKVLRLYQRIEGTYESQIQIPGSTFNPIHARVTLSATVMADGKPVLKAYYERLDVFPVTDYNQELVVDYKTESYPQKISLVASSGANFSFFGTIYTGQEVTNKSCNQNYVDKECQFYMQGDLTLTKNVRVATKLVRIKDRYQATKSQVLGRYQGAMSVKDRPSIKFTLSVFPQEVVDANGVRRTAIQAYLQRSDKPTGAAIYSVSYNDVSGAETYNMYVSLMSNMGVTDILTLRGNLKSKVFKAEVLTGNGLIGKVDLKWVSEEVIVNSDGIENQINQALYAEYKKVAGTYKGTVDFKGADRPPLYTASFQIRATMTATGKPELRAYYTRSDDPDGDLALELLVNYKTETFPKQITMSAVDGVGFRGYPLSVDGVLVEANPAYIEGRFFAPKGRSADVKLVKTK